LLHVLEAAALWHVKSDVSDRFKGRFPGKLRLAGCGTSRHVDVNHRALYRSVPLQAG